MAPTRTKKKSIGYVMLVLHVISLEMFLFAELFGSYDQHYNELTCDHEKSSTVIIPIVYKRELTNVRP